MRKFPKDVSVIPTRSVYTPKEDDLKEAVFKARCRGTWFRQKEVFISISTEYCRQWSNCCRSGWLTLIATEYDYPIYHLDNKLAYLNAPLPQREEIYVAPPLGHDNQPGFFWFLKKSGKFESNPDLNWYTCLATQLTKLGLIHNDIEETIFSKQTEHGILIVALYVDDLFLVAENETNTYRVHS